jgi:phosphodiesterase/alkaline phosphatase D-like protein
MGCGIMRSVKMGDKKWRQVPFVVTFMVTIFCFVSLPIVTKAASLSRGAVLGSLTDTSVKVWARTDSAGTFKIEYKTSVGSYPGTYSSTATTSSGGDYTNVVTLSGLTANTAYDYRVYVDDVLASGTGASGSFTTMKTAGTACSYRFSLTGDLAYNQAPFSLMTSASAKSPLFSVFPGDQIYGPATITKPVLESYYQDNWGVSTLRSFLDTIPGFFIWDDHELPNPPSGQANNWDAGKAGDYSIARTVYEEYQNSVNPSPLVAGETYYTFQVCDTSFFVADTRSYRSPTYATDSTNNDLFGTAQLEHIKSWLVNDTSTIKFLMSPDPWPDNVSNGNDSFRGYNNERQEIYTYIKQNNIRNVFILSGDQHNEVLYKTDLSNTNKLYEFGATPVGSDVQTTDGSLSATGTASTKVCINSSQSKHYGIIDVDTTASPAQVIFKSYNSSDTNLCNQTITLSNSGPATPTVASAADQTFNVSGASTSMSTMTITDAATATVTATNDIRIRIPSTTNMTWDTSVTTATIGGAASAKVSGASVTYEDSNKTAVINVTSSFASGDVVTITGLKFTSFSAATAKTNLGVDVTNDGGADSTDSKTIEILPTSGAAVYTAKNHAFTVSQTTQAIDTITVVDGSTPGITSANDIRVKIPASFNMTWDASDTTATIGGTASGKVSTTVSYADSDKTLVLDVTSNFVAGDYITIAGLSQKSFTSTSSSANIGIDTNNDGTNDATDPKSIKEVGSTTRVWTALGGDKLWSNALNWSGQTVPIAGDAVLFDGTSTTDCIVDYTANNLASITLDTLYTGTVRFTPYAVEGTIGSLTLTSSLTVNGGTLVFEGDSHVDSDSSTPSVNDGTGYTITSPSITVGSGGRISADAEGFEQGVGPGFGGVASNAGGTGGSYGGVGGYPISFGVTPSATYGSATSPLSLGSGGGFSESVSGTTASNGAGGAGGGALKLNVSGTLSVDGTLSANGENAVTGTSGNNRYGAGSGGSIWIAATTVSGSGTISANGGTTTGTDAASTHPGGTGGGGRISFGSSGYSFSGSVQVNGGSVATTYASTGTAGRAGTVSFPSATLNNFTLSNTLTLGNDIAYTFGILTIVSGGTLTFDGNPLTGTGATVSATTITIDSGGTLSVNGKGYHSGDTNASGLGTGGTTSRGAGGGYGGRGGDTAATYAGTGGAKYGSATSPVSLGSGGTKASSDGAGGGALKINLSGTLTVNGTFSADGNAAGSNATERGAGSGGSLWVNGGTLAGSGTIRANGGAGGTGGGAGGGGRISLGVTSNSFSGVYQVSGGARGASSHPGYSGTISFPTDTDLTIAGAMTLGNDISYTFHTVTINSGGTLTLDIDPTANSNNGSGTTITTGNLTVASGGTLTASAMGHTDTSSPASAKGSTGTSNRVGGAGHGGAGGAGAVSFGSPAGGSAYDSSSNPVNPGSSCSSATTCVSARGGGAMVINVKNNFVHNGTISANTTANIPASGGSINFTVKNWSGTTGTMTATGGSVTTGSGGGAGGLIKVDYVNKTYSGTAPSAAGGTSTGGTPGASGSAGVVTQNAVTDTTAPTVSSVASSSITETGATITWLTDEEGSSIVDYGTTTSYGTSTTETDTGTRVISHSVALTGLTGGTTYHFQVRSKDDAGTPNTGTSSDYTFTTTAAPDTTAPSISNIVATPTHNSVQITWDTDEAASSYVDYGATSSYGTTTSEVDTSPRVTSHSVTISSLSSATVYHFRLNSKDAATNNGQSTDQTVTTSAAPDTTAPVISSVVATPSGTSVVITWDTDENASSIVDYGATASYGTTTSEADTSPHVTSHSVTVSGLSSQTTYHFRVKSNDASSNLAIGSDDTFTTTDVTAPVISSVLATPSSTSVVITWTTDEIASSYVDYGTTSSYGTTTTETDTSPRVTSHVVSISGLSPTTTYHFRVNSVDASTNLTTDSDNTFITTSVPSSGGGGGLVFVAPQTVPYAPVVIPQATPDTNNISSGGVATPTTLFTQNLKTGMTNSDVLLLQQLLNQNGFTVATSGAGVKGKETTKYGSATRAAVKAFQHAYGVTPENGLFGPKTRAVMNTLLQNSAFKIIGTSVVTTPVTATPDTNNISSGGVATPTTLFTQNLKTGMTNSDVLLLQQLLNQNGFTVATSGAGVKGKETTKYGSATRAAVKAFQHAYGVTPENGFFGPKTRAKVNSLLEKRIFTIVK